MDGFLKQSTAVDVLIGPFVDSGDGYTAETGVSPSVELSKNGQALGAKSDATTPVHDSDGYYNCELDSTDTNTVGQLVLRVAGSATHLPVRHVYQVLDEVAYDTLFGSSATILTSEDVGIAYKSTIGTVNSQTSFVMDDNIAVNNSWVGNLVTIEDVTGGTIFSTWCASSTASSDTLTIDTAATFTAAVGDVVRVYGVKHPRYEIDDYAPYTAASGTSFEDTVLGYVQLITRKDSAIATDRSAELTAINADEGTGSGSYDNATDSIEANQDDITTLTSDVATVDTVVDTLTTDLATVDTVVDAIKAKTDSLTFSQSGQVDSNVQRINDVTVVGAGTSGNKWRA